MRLQESKIFNFKLLSLNYLIDKFIQFFSLRLLHENESDSTQNLRERRCPM
jgi:hypothetical protein